MNILINYFKKNVLTNKVIEKKDVWIWWEKRRLIFNMNIFLMMLIPKTIGFLFNLSTFTFFTFGIFFFFLLSVNFLFFLMPVSDYINMSLTRENSNSFRQKLFILTFVGFSFITILFFSWVFIFNNL
jgi:hypothetical protein